MIHSTATVPVNPDGETELTRAQAWRGLVLKARDARQFLPPHLCTRCEVVEESATHLVREATIGGLDLREIIAFEPEAKVTFFQASGPREGAIVNDLFEGEAGALQLRFSCYLGLRGKAPGGPEEQAERAQVDSDGATRRPCCRRCSVPASCSTRAASDRARGRSTSLARSIQTFRLRS